VLTEAGRLIIQKAMRIEEMVVDFDATLRSISKGSAPLVSIRMSEGVASYLIAPVMAGQELGPLGIAACRDGLRLPPIKIITPDSPQRADITLAWVPKGKIPSGHQNDKVRKLTDISFAPFHSEKYRNKDRAIDQFDDLLGHHIVTLDAYQWFREGGWQDWHMLTSTADTSSTNWSCSVGHLTLNGIGIGLLPTYTPLYASEMKPLDIHVPSMEATLWMMSPEESAKDPAVRECLTVLGKLFNSADWMRPI